VNEILYKKCSYKIKGGATQKLIQHLVFKGTSIQGKNRLRVIFKSDGQRQQILCRQVSLLHTPLGLLTTVLHSINCQCVVKSS